MSYDDVIEQTQDQEPEIIVENQYGDYNEDEQLEPETSLEDQLEALRAENAKLSKQYKSLQGMGNPRTLKAELEELRAQMNELSRPAPKAPEPYAATLPSDIAPLFDDKAPAFEQYISSQVGPLVSQLQKAMQEIAELKQESARAPFKALRASDTDGIFQAEEFKDFLKESVDEFGLTMEDRIRQISLVDADRGAAMMSRAKQAYLNKTKGGKTVQGLKTQTPARPVGQGAALNQTPQTGGRQTIEQLKVKLQSDYETLLGKPLTAEVRDQRTAIVVKAAQHGIKLDT
jgi:chorismate mutase